MVPNLSPSGYSFIGATKYLDHDKGREQSRDRVEWTSTRNLMCDDPETVVRIMIATALDADRLKQKAGVKPTGRKSAKHVQTLSLAWHPDEKVSREEMEAAVDEVIALLDLKEHQIAIWSHTDTLHQHVHLLINRVNPWTGVMATLSNAHRKLDRWSHDYEKRRDNIVSVNRDAKYRRQEVAKTVHPDAKKRRAYAEQKRAEAREKVRGKPVPKSKRFEALKAADDKRRAALKAPALPEVPLDHQEAIDWLFGPLMRDRRDPDIETKTALLIFALDPDNDISLILREHLPDIRNPQDPRELRERLNVNWFALNDISDAIHADPAMQEPYEQLSDRVSFVARSLKRKHSWQSILRTVALDFSLYVADALTRVVGVLANFFRDEKIAKHEEQAAATTTTAATGTSTSSQQPQAEPKQGRPPVKPTATGGLSM